jgi:uncharacterized membrane protein
VTEPSVHPRTEESTDSWTRSKQVFRRGLAALLPTLLTLIIFFKVFEFLRDNVGYWISRGLTYFWEGVFGYRVAVNSWAAHLLIVVGLILAALAVFILGYAVSTVVGRWVYALVDGWLSRLPMVRQVYPSVKQVTNFLLREQTFRFTQVVGVPYPRPGAYALGFVTESTFREVDRVTGRRMVCVFVPSSPTPFTGYAILFREEEVVYLEVSVEQALRFIISCGVVSPGSPRGLEAAVGMPVVGPGEGSSTPGPEAPTSSL